MQPGTHDTQDQANNKWHYADAHTPTAHSSYPQANATAPNTAGPTRGRGAPPPNGGMAPHTSGSAPDGKRPSTTGPRHSAPAATCPSPAAKHGTSDITTGATDTTDPNTRAATAKREQPTATACANTGTNRNQHPRRKTNGDGVGVEPRRTPPRPPVRGLASFCVSNISDTESNRNYYGLEVIVMSERDRTFNAYNLPLLHDVELVGAWDVSALAPFERDVVRNMGVTPLPTRRRKR